MGSEDAQEKVLRNVDTSRRSFLKKLIVGGAFAAPAVASFSMSGIGVEKVEATPSNQSQFSYPGIPGQENCYGQTIAYLEHPLTQAVPAQCLTQAWTYYATTVLNLPPTHGVAALANQWCTYGTSIPISPPV